MIQTDTNIGDSTIERLPPQSLESEQAVLGALLVSGDGLMRIVDILEPEHFYRKAHQTIFAAMMDLYQESEPIDIVTVSQSLKDLGKLDSVGGRQYITDLSMSVATTANLEYYAKVVQEKALLRMLIKAGGDIVGTCYEENDASVALDKAEKLIFSLASKRDMQALTHIKNVVETSFQKSKNATKIGRCSPAPRLVSTIWMLSPLASIHLIWLLLRHVQRWAKRLSF